MELEIESASHEIAINSNLPASQAKEIINELMPSVIITLESPHSALSYIKQCVMRCASEGADPKEIKESILSVILPKVEIVRKRLQEYDNENGNI